MTAPAITVSSPSLIRLARGYLTITKPAIISLLLITTVPAMVVAQGGWPSTWLVIATVIGGTLSAAGANAVNCWYDRDIDALMSRTRHRPIVQGDIEPAHALIFGLTLGVAAFAMLAVTANVEAAAFASFAYLFYVVVYTAWLKRRTPQNIVIGGAAGAFPPLVGWAAVTGDIAWAPVVMFGIVFLWTPPHFWALSLRLKDDYGRAGVPMLPVVAGPERTRREILRYSFILTASTLILPLVSDISWIYLAVAAGVGAWFTWLAYRLWASPETESPMRLYLYSLLYLAVLFVAMAVDVAVLA